MLLSTITQCVLHRVRLPVFPGLRRSSLLLLQITYAEPDDQSHQLPQAQGKRRPRLDLRSGQFIVDVYLHLPFFDPAGRLQLSQQDAEPGGNETVLMDGGMIYADVGETVEIDLSKTSLDAEYLMINTSTQIFNLHNTEFPKVDSDGEALLLTEDTKVLPIVYEWEGITPEISIEQLVSDAGGNMSWRNAGGFTVKASEDGMLEIGRGESDPGTYRLTMVWSDSGYEVCRLETTLFVKYE